MKEITKTEARTDRHGFVPGVAHLALDVVDRSQSLAIAVLHDARVEIRTIADGAIDLAEKTSASAFRFAKKLAQRVDEGVAETLNGAEKIVGGALKSARETTKAATDLAHVAGQGIAGERTTTTATA